MFITKKSLSRRTVLRGLGATVGVPFLEAMVPALANAQALRAPLRFGAVYVPNGCPMDFWMPKGEAGELQITPILQPMERHRQHMTVINNLVACRRQIGHGSRRELRGLVERCDCEADRGRGHSRRHHDRPDFREATRPGNAVSVARVRDRGLRRLHRRLRAGLQLHVHEHDLVGVGDRAAAHGDQSARRLRAHVRPCGHAGAAAPPLGRRPEHPRFHRRRSAFAEPGGRRGRPQSARRLSGERARDRTTHPEDGRARLPPRPTR